MHAMDHLDHGDVDCEMKQKSQSREFSNLVHNCQLHEHVYIYNINEDEPVSNTM